MGYQTQKDKIIDWIEKGLIPKLPERNYPYDDIISAIALEIGTTEKMVEDVIKSYIKLGKIKHENWLVATDEQAKAHLEKQKEINKEMKEIIDEIKSDGA